MLDPNNSSILYSGGYVYVSTYYMSVSKSTDAGATWLIRDTLNTVYSTCDAIRVNPMNSNVVYAGGYTGVYKSTDAGNTWALSSTGLTGQVYDIAVHGSQANVVYAASGSGVFKSTDAGASWTNTGCTNVYTVLIDPANPNTIYAGTYTGVYKSTIGGGGWTAMNTGLQDLYVTSLSIYANNWLFCGTKGAGMYRWSLAVGAEEHNETNIGPGIYAQPNPARGRAVINYTMIQALPVRIAMYDLQGRLLITLVDEGKPAGQHAVTWNARDGKGERLPAGIYFCRLSTPKYDLIEKVILTD